MSDAALDRLLAALVVAMAVTGVFSLRSGSPTDAWLFGLHGILAGGLALAAAAKIGRSLPKGIRARRWGRVALGVVVSLATVAALVFGFAWVASGRLLTVGHWTVMTIHAWIGLALVPLVAVHLLPRRWRLLVPRRAGVGGVRTPRSTAPRSRRQVLTLAGLGALAVAAYATSQVADRLAGGVRRFTGSRWLPPGGVPPPTTFYGEAIPAIDRSAWRLHVSGRVARATSLTSDELAALGTIERRAVLDCTSGWALETSWTGVPVSSLLAAVGAEPSRRVVVRSVTGWASVLEAADLDRAILATGVADGPLPAANGAPCRLVVPDRRGLDWVKWVAKVEVL